MRPDRIAIALRRLKTSREDLVWVLLYSDVQGSTDKLGEWKAPALERIPPDDGKAETDELAASIFQAAQWHCDEMAVSCRYKLIAQTPDGTKQLLSVPLLQQPEGQVAFEGVRQVEDPSAAGLVGQALRHTEATMHTLLKSIQLVLSTQNDQLNRMSSMVARMQDRENAVNEALSSIHEITGDAEARIAREQRHDQLLQEAVQQIAPAVIAKLLPKESH